MKKPDLLHPFPSVCVPVIMPADVNRSNLTQLLEQADAGPHITAELPAEFDYIDLQQFAEREGLTIHILNGQIHLLRLERPLSMFQIARDFALKPQAF